MRSGMRAGESLSDGDRRTNPGFVIERSDSAPLVAHYLAEFFKELGMVFF